MQLHYGVMVVYVCILQTVYILSLRHDVAVPPAHTKVFEQSHTGVSCLVGNMRTTATQVCGVISSIKLKEKITH